MSGPNLIDSVRQKSMESWLKDDCPEPFTLFAASEPCDQQPQVRERNGECLPTARAVRLYRFKDFRFCAIGGWTFWKGDEAPGHNIVPSHGRGNLDSTEVKEAFSGTCSDDITTAFILTHNPSEPYGHFLLEMAPKLVAYNRLAAVKPDLPILLSWYTPDYVVKWINFLARGAPIIRIPRSSVVNVRRPFFCDMLIWNYWPSAGFSNFINSCKMHSFAQPPAPLADKIFLSRKSRRLKNRDFRRWKNEDEAAAKLSTLGFMIFEPEEHDLATQIQTFAQAKIIVGELSSALHNAIFSPADTHVVQINPFNGLQTKLSYALGQQLDSILPETGKLCGWPPMQEDKQNFTVSVDAILGALGLH